MYERNLNGKMKKGVRRKKDSCYLNVRTNIKKTIFAKTLAVGKLAKLTKDSFM